MNKHNFHPLVIKWFDCWTTGQLDHLPITDDFIHTSPFGTIEGKRRYMEIVGKNTADFLGNEFKLLNQIQEGDQICVQFEQTNHNTGLHMVVCEWYQIQGDMIQAIRSFYNIGDAQIKG